MSWVRIDTGFARHPKLVRLPPVDRWRHLEAMAWCAEQCTDGAIEVEDLAAIWPGMGSAPALRLARRLQEAGLWDQVGAGWLIHDWLDYNIPAERAKERRRLGAERQRRRRGRVTRDVTHDEPRDVTRYPSRAGTGPDPTPRSGPPQGSPPTWAAPPPPAPGAPAAPPEAARGGLAVLVADLDAAAAETSNPTVRTFLERRAEQLRAGPSFDGTLGAEEVLPSGLRRWEEAEIEKYRATGDAERLRELERGGSEAARQVVAEILRGAPS